MPADKCQAAPFRKRPLTRPLRSRGVNPVTRGARSHRTPLSDSVTECDLVSPPEMCFTRPDPQVGADVAEQFHTEIPHPLLRALAARLAADRCAATRPGAWNGTTSGAPANGSESGPQ